MVRNWLQKDKYRSSLCAQDNLILIQKRIYGHIFTIKWSIQRLSH
jgi:hypothetical protein